MKTVGIQNEVNYSSACCLPCNEVICFFYLFGFKFSFLSSELGAVM